MFMYHAVYIHQEETDCNNRLWQVLWKNKRGEALEYNRKEENLTWKEEGRENCFEVTQKIELFENWASHSKTKGQQY